ncbi:hypothetical protein [Streptomyces sp. NPDC020489]|uniref:hypothetical protein n=1 Tax=Streptomyces sp. NPDC020489 TaxID=3365077 RepID=UPI00378CC92D
MTAPATPRTPTPADLARRTAPVAAPAAPTAPRAEDALAPGKLAKKEHFRKFFLFGLRRSRMHAHARLVGHDLMWRANHATGQVSPTMHVSSDELALATGLTAGQVDVALQVLHTRGWLHYRRIAEGPRTGQRAMVLTIPAGALEQIRNRKGPREYTR